MPDLLYQNQLSMDVYNDVKKFSMRIHEHKPAVQHPRHLAPNVVEVERLHAHNKRVNEVLTTNESDK